MGARSGQCLLRRESLRSARCVGVRPFETWEAGEVASKIEPVLVVNDLEVACEARSPALASLDFPPSCALSRF